jgi:MFS family permease
MVIPVFVFCWTILKKKTFCSALTYSLEGMLFGRFLVGIGMGLGPPVASLYITEVCIVSSCQCMMSNNMYQYSSAVIIFTSD